MHSHDDTPAYKFCPVCGSPLEPRVLKITEPKRLVCTNTARGFVFYLDPKVAVGTIIRTPDDRIVLVRRAIHPGYGLWVFPGGYVDRGEEVHAAAIREAREECGLDVRLEGLVNIYSYPGCAPIVIVYAASAVGGDLCGDEECLETALFSPAALPWDELAFASTNAVLLGATNAPTSYPLAVAVEKGAVKAVATERGTTRLVVVGDSFFLNNQLIESAANRDFASHAINWLTDRTQLMAGLGPRPVKEFKLFMTRSQLGSARWLLLGGLPGAILLIGGLVWFSRRN